MKSKIAPVLVICAMAGLVNLTDSCKKDEDASSTLIVKVLYGNQPMGNVHVFTVPYTSDAITDVYGLTKIEGISSGEYQVYAESGNVTGKSIVILGENDAQNVTVGVNYTGPITFIPQINFILPDLNNAYAPGDTVVFRVKVTNYKEGSQVSWHSNLDGHLASTPIDEAGFSNFSTSKLRQGEHTISATAAGKEGYNAIRVKQIDIDGPQKVYLYPLDVQGTQALLKWSKYRGNDFDFYQAECRFNTRPDEPFTGTISTGHLIAQGDTSVTIQLPVSYYSAQVYVMAGNTNGSYNVSNIRELNRSIGPIIDGIPVQMLQHPLNTWVYLVFSDHAIIYDYQNKEIIATATTGTTAKFIDLGDNGAGLELYLADNASVIVLDGNTLGVKRTIAFPHDLISVVSSGLGFLICAQKSDASDIKPLQVYSLVQQAFIAEGGNPFETLYMKKVPGRNVLVACTRQGYGSELDYFEYNEAGFIILQKNIYNASGGFSVDVMEVSPGGDYFCVGDDAYFRKTDQTLASVAYLQDSDPATDFAFNDEGSITWCCSDKRSLIQEYHYPSGSLVRLYSAYGNPLHMVFRDNSCIVATLTGFGSECCVEVIPVGK